MILLYIWIAAQIILEMLPISSSTHLRLIELWFKRAFSWDIGTYFKQRSILLSDVYHFMHLPTLIIMVWYYHSLLRALDFQTLKHLIISIVIIDTITVAIYYLFKKYTVSWPLIFGMSITALVLLYTGSCSGISSDFTLSFLGAVFLGIAQGIALLPGISRLAFTTAAGCCLGLPLLHAFSISWLMYIPLMAAAIVKSIINLYSQGTHAQLLNWRICLVMLVSGILSWYVFTRVLFIILINKWWLFGWYMILPISLWVLFTYKKR